MFRKTDQYLLFHTVLQDVRKDRPVKLILAELSGIQRFIFRDTDVRTSAEEIGRRSAHIETVTERCAERITAAFAGKHPTVLNRSSGKLLIAVDRSLRDERITSAMNDLQRTVFASDDGLLELYYAFTTARITDEARPGETNAMDVLRRAAARNRYHCTNLLCPDIGSYKDAAFSFRTEEKTPEPVQEMRMAIKLDLDNLGMFFGKLEAIDVADAASVALNETLKAAISDFPGVKLIFAGGDDLFLTAPLETWIFSLAKIYRNIRAGIDARSELAPYREAFGVSGGVSLIRNDLAAIAIPLLYYYDASETELEQAKTHGKNRLFVEGVPVTWDELLTLADTLKKSGAAAFGTMDQEQRTLYTVRLQLLAKLLLPYARDPQQKDRLRALSTKEVG